jgi:hypothetical protein
VNCTNAAGTVVQFNVTAMSACSSNVLVVCTPPSGSLFPAGATTVNCQGSDDRGNTNHCSFTVTVLDREPPTITCPTNVLVVADVGQCAARVDIGLPTAEDNCDGAMAVAVTGTRSDGLPLGEPYPRGTTIITWTATDRAGNSDRCMQTVTVNYRDCIPVPLSLAAWWPLDEPSGLVARDIAGHARANDGVLLGGVSRAAGHVAGALQFDGTNGFVEVADEREVNPGGTGLTLDAWINPSAIDGTRPIVDKRDPSPRGYALFLEDGKLGCQLANGSGFDNYVALAGPTIPMGTWTHVAVTAHPTAGVGVLYLNGAPVHSFVPRAGPYANTNALLIGRRHFVSGFPVTYFQGLIDEVELFVGALSAEEIAAIFAAGCAGRCKEVCHTSWEAPTPSPGTATVDISLCNYAPVDQAYAWSIAPKVPGCESQSPTDFTPSSGLVFVPAVSCTNFPVLIETPAGAAYGHGCYTVRFTNLMTGAVITCPGSTYVYNPWSIVPRVLVTMVAEGATSNIVFDVTNWNPDTATLRYEFGAMPTDMQGPELAVSIEGLPPGTTVPGEITLPAGGRGAITARVAFAVSEPFRTHDLLVLVNVNGRTEPVASTAVWTARPVPPPRLLMSLASCDGRTIRLIYNKPVQLDGRYALDRGGVIDSMEYGASQSEVVLRTQPLRPGVAYTLTAEGVHDLETSPKLISPDPTYVGVRSVALPSGPARLSIRRLGRGAGAPILIEWTDPNCKLQCATELHSDPLRNVWTDVAGAASPYTTAASLDKKFFRLICLGNCP